MGKQKQITIWESWDQKTDRWNHNHIEDGWVEGSKPTPKSKEQKKPWSGQAWKKEFGWLINSIVEGTGHVSYGAISTGKIAVKPKSVFSLTKFERIMIIGFGGLILIRVAIVLLGV